MIFRTEGTIGICICATTGCRRHADETAHLAWRSNGHVNLVQELHLWNLHGLQQLSTTTGMSATAV